MTCKTSRKRPAQHKRRLKSGKVVTVNKGIKKAKRRMGSPPVALEKPVFFLGDKKGIMLREDLSDDRLYPIAIKRNMGHPQIIRKQLIDEEERRMDYLLGHGREKTAARSRYKTTSGKFKKMTDPDKPWSGKKSKFYGCERAQRAKGHSKDSAQKICGYIAARKKGYGRFKKK